MGEGNQVSGSTTSCITKTLNKNKIKKKPVGKYLK